MSDPEQTVDCPRHGARPATRVCRHLAGGLACGYHSSWSGRPGDPWPDAWCDACFVVLEREQGWNAASESFAGVTRLCAGCYEEARERNVKVPFDSPRDAPELSAERFEALLDRATNYVEACQEGAGSPPAPDAQLVGRLQGGIWRWAWERDDVPAPRRELAERLQIFGQARDVARLTEPGGAATEHDAWRLTCLACYLADAEAAHLVAREDGVVGLVSLSV